MTLASWAKKFFEPSDQVDYLIYVVYGDIGMSRGPMSRSKYYTMVYRKTWSMDDWHKTIFKTASAQPLEQTAIFVSQENSSEWVHTRGLRKFGCPDISVRSVLPDKKDDIIELCCRLIEFQAYEGISSRYDLSSQRSSR